MNHDQILEVLHTLPCQQDRNHGALICFPEIYESLSHHDLGRKYDIKIKLYELEQTGTIKVIHFNEPGFRDVVAGIQLTNIH
ncbi:hypothetical protein ACFQZR_22240 [Paenibacillus sp. GCM10027629]|uniref:hypothetical protein n=1 Tax=Paenibacillus sp. GCM10027629 TaxID=3273414 RepID=UPI003633FFF9